MSIHRLVAIAFIALASVFSADAQLLWRVDGNGVERPSYLFGTHHVAPVNVLDSIQGLADAVASVDAAYGELDMLHGASERTRQLMPMMAVAPADSVLNRVLPEGYMKKLGEELSRLAGYVVDPTQLDLMKPALANMQLAILQSIAAFPDYDPSVQLDVELLKRAAAAGASTHGLETPEFQISLLFDTPISVQAEELAKAIDNAGEAVAKARELAGYYRRGDLDAMDAVISDSDFGMTPAEAERMLYSRNDAWVKTLTGVFPKSSVLVVVGAGHLAGERGLICRLRSMGYTVTAVTE